MRKPVRRAVTEVDQHIGRHTPHPCLLHAREAPCAHVECLLKAIRTHLARRDCGHLTHSDDLHGCAGQTGVLQGRLQLGHEPLVQLTTHPPSDEVMHHLAGAGDAHHKCGTPERLAPEIATPVGVVTHRHPLKRPNHPARIVGVNGCRRRRVARLEFCHRGPQIALHKALRPAAHVVRGRWAHLHFGEGGPDVQPRPSGEQRRAPCVCEPVDQGVCARCVGARA